MDAGLLRSLCFHDAWGYAPTVGELESSRDLGGLPLPLLRKEGTSPESFPPYEGGMQGGLVRGRVVFPGREALIAEHELRERLFARKLRRARRVATWLRCISGVRFVALCNTTALAHARDEGDLDFFIIARTGTLWQTRGWAALPFKFLGLRPGGRARDPVCFSFFVDETALDLSPLMLDGDDPYFRHWFLSILPLEDDGVGEKLWEANVKIRERHPEAVKWISTGSRIQDGGWRVPTPRFLERIAERLQSRALPKMIRERMNHDTSVVVNDHVLKFHVEDGRDRFRDAYAVNCQRYGVAP